MADLPVFLCPGVLRIATKGTTIRCDHRPRTAFRGDQRRFESSTALETSTIEALPGASVAGLDKLPQQCAGCGTFSQLVDPEGPGFYTLSRGSVKTYLKNKSGIEGSGEDEIIKKAFEQAADIVPGLELSDFTKRGTKGHLLFAIHILIFREVRNTEPPVCDRCHQLKHHDTGISIHHPSIDSIQATILESPYKYNHIYHVLDAADFPMSLVPGLQKLLHLTPQRSQNRRAKTEKFYHGRKTEVSFIITRSDLLAPVKEQVDAMMPYLRAVLRDALGRTGKDVRLGNVRTVSSKRDWWTKQLKEDIWHRGGGGWMVGKVNVGKSQLFHSVFPKGRRERAKLQGKKLDTSPASILQELQEKLGVDGVVASTEKLSPENASAADYQKSIDAELAALQAKASALDTDSLLPPAPPEEDYPPMPLVSALPGTTASPIRLSFGNGKGELVDLPGLSRGDLEHHVQAEHRASLVMRSRITPSQLVLKPGKSLLLGGFIRITPTTPDLVILSYAFTPIKAHLTSTEKAIDIQTEVSESKVENIALPGTGAKIKSAGIFHLKWDVTRARSGPLTNPAAVGMKPENLPFRVLSTDILIEGCGWVELVAQVRKPRNFQSNYVSSPTTSSSDNTNTETTYSPPSFSSSQPTSLEDDECFEFDPLPPHTNTNPDPIWPAVEVFTPNGKFVGSRRPMNAWLNYKDFSQEGKIQGRPRKAMKGVKKVKKNRERAKLSRPL